GMTRIEQRDWKKICKHREKQISDNQTSDRKPSRLPFRLKELRTFATFPTFKHTKMSLRLMVGAS
ncbi:MAG: hypothetical protein DBY44_07455, partial [Veillonellaceae bacterium]